MKRNGEWELNKTEKRKQEKRKIKEWKGDADKGEKRAEKIHAHTQEKENEKTNYFQKTRKNDTTSFFLSLFLFSPFVSRYSFLLRPPLSPFIYKCFMSMSFCVKLCTRLLLLILPLSSEWNCVRYINSQKFEKLFVT